MLTGSMGTKKPSCWYVSALNRKGDPSPIPATEFDKIVKYIVTIYISAYKILTIYNASTQVWFDTSKTEVEAYFRSLCKRVASAVAKRLKVNELRFFVLFVVNGSIKKLFLIDFVNIFHLFSINSHKKNYNLETCAWLLLMLLQNFLASARSHRVHKNFFCQRVQSIIRITWN